MGNKSKKENIKTLRFFDDIKKYLYVFFQDRDNQNLS